MALPRRWAQALATSARTAANPSPASRMRALNSARSQSQDAFFPFPPTLKLGNFGLACCPMASSRSSSSSIDSSSPHPVRDLVEAQAQLVVGVADRARRRRREWPTGRRRTRPMDRRRVGGCGGDPFLDQVPVVVEGLGQRLQGRGLDAGGEEQQDRAFEAGSARSWSRKDDQRLSKATDELTSSSTSTRGGSPASTGCSESRRWANACRVPMAAPSSCSRARRQRAPTSPSGSASAAFSSAARMRSRSSAPAFSVKVMAAMRRSSTWPVVTRARTRLTRAEVLPDPAPASTKRVVSRSSVIRSRAA